MNAVRRLRSLPDQPGMAPVQPALHLVRRQDDQQDTAVSHPGREQARALPHGVGRLDELRPQRVRSAPIGEGEAAAGADWPGRAWGIRAPRPAETALSWAEVEIALRDLHA